MYVCGPCVYVWPTKGQLAVNKQGKWSIKALVLVVVFVWLLLRFNLHPIQTHFAHTQTQMCSTLCLAFLCSNGVQLSWNVQKKSREKNTIERQTETDRLRDRHRTCRRFRTSKRPLLLLLLHSLHLFTCWLCVYRKLAARILPLELSASPSLALALIGHCRRRCWRCLIASDSFKEPLKGLPILYTLPRSLSVSLTLFFAFSLCVFSKLTVAQIFACAYVSGNFTQTSSAAGHAEWCERTKAGHTSN